MDDEHFSEVLDELMDKIDNGPGSHAEEFAKHAQRHVALKEFKKIVSDLTESLGCIRLMTKYLVFDLEATRRERDNLVMKLEDMD